MDQAAQLSQLVTQGKNEVAGFVKNHLYAAHAAKEERVDTVISSLLMLSLKKEPPQIDVARLRLLLVEENEGLLAHAAESDQRILFLFAVATGRVMQIREYVAAIDRIRQTYVDEDTAIQAHLLSLREDLLAVERGAVRIMIEQGRPALQDVQSLID